MNDGFAFPFAIALIVSMMGVDTAVSVLPRAGLESFYVARSVTAERVGNTAHLTVNREVKRPIHMGFVVRVFEKAERGWAQVCFSEHGPFLYTPEDDEPDPITMDWWTVGDCPVLPPGPARIVTTWTPEPQGMGSVSIVTEVP
jgi:hypothetical protein